MASQVNKIRRSAWTLMLVAMVIFSCTKDRSGIVPNVPVNLQIYMSNPEYSNLLFEGGWEYITGGSMGLLVYRYNTESFKAFDRHAPYDVDRYCQLYVDSTNIIVRDSCSGSAFLLIHGSVANGPATQPMKEYFTDFDGEILTITN